MILNADPLASAIASDGLIWAETTADHPTPTPVALSASPPPDGDTARTAYTTGHSRPWGGAVAAYLVTKALGAGIFLWLSLAVLAGWPMDATGALVKAGGLGILGLLATTALLVADLERPERFLRILLRPQWKSWLTRGAFILVIFTHLVMGWWGLELAADVGWVGVDTAAAWRPMLAGLTLPLAVGAAVYTAFLFAQCEGRDLWQTPVAPVHMLLQSAMAGAAGLVLLGIGGATVASLLLGLIIADAALISAEEFGSTHQSEQAAQAAHMITHGAYKNWFWWGTVATGHLLPIALLLTAGPALGIPAALATLVGLYAYEHAFVMAPQDIPNS
jgi:formate-dependent nitrite reductase membrane component NrfD